MVRKSYNSGSYVAYTYNAEGSLARLSYGDSTGELASYRFEYDSLGRLIRSAELDADGGTVQRTEHIYDGYNRLSRQSWTLGGKTYSESYVYDDPSDTNQNGDGASDTNKNGDGALTQMTTATGAVIDYQYDTLRRLTRSKVALNGSTVYTTAYAFRDLDASRTTTQVQYRNVRSANGEVLEGKKYTYDALGNITRISQSTGHFYPLVAYEYDAQNQLTKETYYNGNGTAAGNITRTISYTYDTAGNILSETKTVNDKTTTKTFSYTDSNWKDLLTAVNGLSITYDASGNPETYYTGSVDRRGNAEVYYMYWGNGRQLTDVETDDGQTRSRISYGYDADGIRSWKAVDGEIHTYLTQGGKVMRETVGSTVMDFAYDESGRPFAMTYQSANEDPQTYYYVLNLQGDVVKLVTASGTEAASYAYDAWGNLLSATGGMAYTNPLRYRGYYYDAETRFYYLQSRYYDPVYHRFINADNYASTGQGFLGTNMFAYCNNNPIKFSDPSGHSLIGTLVVGFVIGICGAVLSGCSSRQEDAWPSDSPYKYDHYGSGDNQRNCYTYIFDYPQYWGNPGAFSDNPARYVQARYTRETLIEAVEADAKQMHKDIMLIDSPEDLPSDAILVVAKVSSDGDYHFAAQLGNGDWVDKPGTGESRYNAIDGFASAWTINASSGKIVYDSAPIYFAYYR